MSDYVLEGPRWGSGSAGTSGGTITYAFDGSLPAFFAADIEAALADWSAHGNIGFQAVASTTGAGIVFGDQAIDGLDNVLATTNYTYAGSTFRSAAITFDSGEGWQASGNQVVSHDSIDLFVVALHEIGHAIGLDHYNAAPAVMNATLDRSVHDLTASDIDGVQALYGTPAATTLARTGTAGDDTLRLGAGDDTVSGGAGRDLIYGNQGADLIYGNGDSDTLFGGQGADRLFGGQGADLVYGNLGDDVVYGNLGDDLLFGGQGADVLHGGQGADVLVGGLGDDVLVGGLGADSYVFGASSGRDLILGFSAAAGDRLSLGGQAYVAATAQDGSALLVLSGGGSIELAGLRPDQVSAAYFA